MKDDIELVYLGRRATQERSAARNSGNTAVREIHLEFALAYEFRIHLLREEKAHAADSRATVIEAVMMPRPDTTRPSDGLKLETEIVCV